MGASTEELTKDIEKTRQNLSADIDELSDKVSPSRVVHRQKEAAKSKLGSLRDQVMGTASDTTGAVSDKASATATSVSDAAQDAAHGAVRTAQGNPLAAGLAAFGVGMVISSLIPASKQEAQVAQLAVDTAKEHAGPALQQGADQLKEAATAAAEDLQSSAQEAAAHVKDEASSAAETVKDDAQSSAESLKQTANDSPATPG